MSENISENIMLSLAAVFGVGVGCQWVAWRLRIPAILLLLLAGLCLGAGTQWLTVHGLLHRQWLNPDELLGGLLLPVVSLSVAIILFEGGLTLDVRQLRQGASPVWRLVSVGALVTWVLTAVAARYILNFSVGLSVLIGAILVVTGPTVIGPLLRFVRPTGAVGPIMRWEGIIIDPIGALLAVVVFEAVIGGGSFTGASVAMSIGKTLLVGTVIGVVFSGVMIQLLSRNWSPDHLHNPLSVMLVLVAFAVSNVIQHESGLVAVTIMGMIMANQKRVHTHHILEFKESLTVLLIASLFILLGARLRLEQIKQLDWNVVLFIVVLIVIVRPLSVYLATIRTSLTFRERMFIAAMAPRGIVAAAVASVFALRLLQHGYPQADRLVPVTFAVVLGTVLIYGLGSPWLSHRLGISKPGQAGFLVAGADRVATEIARGIQKEGYEILLIDTNAYNVQNARLQGLRVILGNALSTTSAQAIALSSIGRVLALTGNSEVNSLVTIQYARQFGRNNAFQLSSDPGKKDRQKTDGTLRGHSLFNDSATHALLLDAIEAGATVKATKLTKEFDYNAYKQKHLGDAIVMFIINERRDIDVITCDETPAPKPGSTVLAMIKPTGKHTAPPVETPTTADAKQDPPEVVSAIVTGSVAT